MADVIWTSEVPDFFQMKRTACSKLMFPLKQTISLILSLISMVLLTPIRLGTLAIAYNTRFVKDNPPAEWADILKPEYKGAFGIANPALSGTSYMSVSLLKDKFGWEFFEKLKSNKAKVGKGAGQVIDDTASGDLLASLAVDYITNDKIKKVRAIKIGLSKRNACHS